MAALSTLSVRYLGCAGSPRMLPTIFCISSSATRTFARSPRSSSANASRCAACRAATSAAGSRAADDAPALLSEGRGTHARTCA